MSSDWSSIIGWTLIHSIWQFGLIYILLKLFMYIKPNLRAEQKYRVFLIGLTIGAVLNLTTLYSYVFASTHHTAIVFEGRKLASANPLLLQEKYEWALTIQHNIKLITLCWLIGFSWYFTRYGLGYRYCQRLKHTSQLMPNEWQKHTARLSQQIGLGQTPKLCMTSTIDTPCTIGHIKPIILLPLGLVSHLSQLQIEAVLLHELSHIKRRDYLVNNVQCLLECIYFFNPFVRWINQHLNQERENDCDDKTIAICQDKLLYAHTLKEFIDMKSNSALPAINGNGNNVNQRIQRLFGIKVQHKSHGTQSILAITLLALTLGASFYTYALQAKAADDVFEIDVKDTAASEVLGMIESFCGTPAKEKLEAPATQMTIKFKTSCDSAFLILQDLNNLAKGYAYLDTKGSVFNGFLQGMKDNECRKLLEDNIKTEGLKKFFIDTRNIPCSTTQSDSNAFSLNLQ